MNFSINRPDSLSYLSFLKVKKSWGHYYLINDSINIKSSYDNESSKLLKGPCYREKILVINPHSEISLQRHKFRKEIWYLKSDNIKVLKGYFLNQLELIIFNNGDIVDIDKNMFHKIINTNNYPIVIYEQQIGMCNEEDITRYDVL